MFSISFIFCGVNFRNYWENFRTSRLLSSMTCLSRSLKAVRMAPLCFDNSRAALSGHVKRYRYHSSIAYASMKWSLLGRFCECFLIFLFVIVSDAYSTIILLENDFDGFEMICERWWYTATECSCYAHGLGIGYIGLNIGFVFVALGVLVSKIVSVPLKFFENRPTFVRNLWDDFAYSQNCCATSFSRFWKCVQQAKSLFSTFVFP